MIAMPKVARVALMMTALAGLSFSAATDSFAQDKGTTKKSKKSEGRVEIREGKDGKFRFMVYSGDKFLGMGAPSGFESPKDAEKAFDELKDVVAGVSKPVMGKKSETKDEVEPKAKSKKGDK